MDHIEIPVRDLVLRGSVYRPAASGRFPVAILHHGFGGQRTEASRLFVLLARALVARGIAVVAMDRAGHGESDGDFADTTVSRDVTDSLELLDRITELGFVDADNVHLLGISLGAVVASVVAAETHQKIRSLTLWSVAAIFVDEIRGGELQGRPIDELAGRGYFDFHGQRVGPEFFVDAKTFDVYGRARGFTGPVRVLHGDQDFIPPIYAGDYERVYGEAMHYTLVAGADHCWETVRARDLVIAETVRFLAGQAAHTPDA